jgi:DNA-binding response OmpR family regulator
MRDARILVMAGEPETATSLAELLGVDARTVDTVTDGAEAFRRVWDADYDVIVTEVGMPGVDGCDLYMALQNTWPELTHRMVFVCRRATEAVGAFVARTSVPLLHAPVSGVDLRAAVGAVRARSGGRSSTMAL